MATKSCESRRARPNNLWLSQISSDWRRFAHHSSFLLHWLQEAEHNKLCNIMLICSQHSIVLGVDIWEFLKVQNTYAHSLSISWYAVLDPFSFHDNRPWSKTRLAQCEDQPGSIFSRECTLQVAAPKCSRELDVTLSCKTWHTVLRITYNKLILRIVSHCVCVSSYFWKIPMWAFVKKAWADLTTKSTRNSAWQPQRVAPWRGWGGVCRLREAGWCQLHSSDS